MAKRAKRRPPRPLRKAAGSLLYTAMEHTSPRGSACATLHPSPSHKRRVARAHAKHSPPTKPTPLPTPTTPDLGSRFHALPIELRAHIFSLLLVRPVKWQLPHQYDLPPRQLGLHCPYPYPGMGGRETCVRCTGGHNAQRIPLWRSRQDRYEGRGGGGLGLTTFVSPWRSKYAPEVTNEFMCSDCWDTHFRPRPHPAEEKMKKHLVCLCARRQDLDILLVCREWYAEAGRVFYTRNTFAFESGAVFTAFVSNLPIHWREAVTRVSITAYRLPSSNARESPSPEERETGFESSNSFRETWSWLRRLPALSYLELDAQFLSRAKTVRALLRLGLRNLRRVCFFLPCMWMNTRGGSEWIWAEYYDSTLRVGGFAEEVARGTKGQQRHWLKKSGAVQRAVELERELQETVRKRYEEEKDVGNGAVHYSSDLVEWILIWWDCDGATRGNGHAYLHSDYPGQMHPSHRSGSEVRHWRDCTSSSSFLPSLDHPDVKQRERDAAHLHKQQLELDALREFESLVEDVAFSLRPSTESADLDFDERAWCAHGDAEVVSDDGSEDLLTRAGVEGFFD